MSEPRRATTKVDNEIQSRVQLTMNLNAFSPDLGQEADEPDSFKSRPHGPLNIITAAHLIHRGVHECPSWLPHWGQPPPHRSFDNISGYKFQAASTSSCIWSLSPDKRILTSFGVVINTLVCFGAVQQSRNPSMVELIETVYDWYTLAKRKATSAQTINLEKFWRTLVLDSYINESMSEAWEWFSIDPKRLLKFARKSMKSGHQQVDRETLANELILMLQITMRGRKFGLTQERMYTMVPIAAKPGDVIVCLWGCDIPVLLRKEADKWVLVRECFVWGMMQGEAMSRAAMLGLAAQDYDII